MKRYKRLGILLGLLVVVCVATFALTQCEEKKEQIKNSDEIILEIPADTVQSLSWECEDGSLAFHKEKTWLYDADTAFPVDEDKINDILSHFEAFGAAFIIENVEDYGQYGLDDPTCTIHLATADTSCDIKLGNLSKMDQQRYVDIGDGNVYLVSDDPLDYVNLNLSDVIKNDEIPSFEKVTEIRFTGSDAYSVSRNDESTDTYSAKDIYFAQLDGENKPLDTGTVNRYLNTVSALDLSEYVTYNLTGEELQTYGLDDPVLSVTVDYTYTDENEAEKSGTCVLHISRNPEEFQAAEEAKAKGEAAKAVTKYLRIGDSQIVYLLDDDDYAILTAASYNDLRHKEVIWADFDDVYRIDITLEDMEHTLTSILEDDARVWYYGNVPGETQTETENQTEDETQAAEEAEPLNISDLQNALKALTADSFTTEAPSGKEEISLKVYLDNENDPTVQIRLYRYDGTSCLAVVDGRTVSLVSRSSVMDLVEAVQAIVLN